MTVEQELLSTAALTVFRLNGQFLALAEELAGPAGLTAARWQVLGAVLTRRCRSPASPARWASPARASNAWLTASLPREWLSTSPTRPKLLAPTDAAFAAVGRIDPAHGVAARRLADEVGADELVRTIEALTTLSAALEVIAPDADI